MNKDFSKLLEEAYEKMKRDGEQRIRGGINPPSYENEEKIRTLEKLEALRIEKRNLNELSDENVKSIGSQLDEVNNEIRKLLLKREVLENSLDNFKKEINSKFDKENPSYLTIFYPPEYHYQ